MTLSIKVSSLDVGYGEKLILGDINFELKKGEILCLMGPNGSGKSTIIKTITEHIKKLGGKIFIDGKDIDTLDQKEKAKHLSVVLTERINPELMTVEDVISSGRYPYTGYLGKLEDKDYKAIDEAIEIVNAESLRNMYFSELSDGQKQRVMLAKAICQEAEVMILDEPTSYLDVRYKIEILGILRQLASQMGKTIILSLHEIDLIPKIADKVLQINGGNDYSYGSPEEIINDNSVTTAFKINRGSYSSLIGNIEMEKCITTPEVFVIGGCGSGVNIYRELNKKKIPFNAGIIFNNDIDLVVASVLACEVITEEAFKDISNDKIKIAEQKIEDSKLIIDSGSEFTGNNRRNRELLEFAISLNKKVVSLTNRNVKNVEYISIKQLETLISNF